MASVSEDCTVKLWSLKGIDHLYGESDGNLEPYITLRGHTGPLFAVANSGSNNPKLKRVLFTGGSEGVIRLWNLPAVSEVNQFGDTFDGRNYCIGQWGGDEGSEVYWDLRHHSYSNMLLAVSAQPEATIWSTAEINTDM
jgi:striatin 1/3/4